MKPASLYEYLNFYYIQKNTVNENQRSFSFTGNIRN